MIQVSHPPRRLMTVPVFYQHSRDPSFTAILITVIGNIQILFSLFWILIFQWSLSYVSHLCIMLSCMHGILVLMFPAIALSLFQFCCCVRGDKLLSLRKCLLLSGCIWWFSFVHLQNLFGNLLIGICWNNVVGSEMRPSIWHHYLWIKHA